jgi:dTDP-4-dehydrorhamnose 3,5-epimerase
MNIISAPIPEVKIIELQKHEDDRGYFARTWCRKELAEAGIDMVIAQCNISFNKHRGTLRGMHYQVPPNTEQKIVFCIKGSIFDVAIDLRPDSPTFAKYFGIELSAENKKQLYIPDGFAHGFLTTDDNTEIYYLMGNFYAPSAGRGVRYNDPRFGIQWPEEIAFINGRDAAYPDASEEKIRDEFQLSR